MRAAVIENGIVTNVIEVESLDFMENLVDASAAGSVGDLYQDGAFVSPNSDENTELNNG